MSYLSCLRMLLLTVALFSPTGSLLAAVDLKVAVDKTVVRPGDRVHYALTVTNTGDAPVTGVVVEDLFPPFMAVTESHIPDGGVCPGSTCSTGERITWDIGTLPANTARTVRFEGTVSTGGSAPADGTVLSNLAELLTDEGDVSKLTDVTVESGRALLASMASDRNPAVPGENLTYRVTFGNAGMANVLNTRLRVPVPDGTTFVSATQGGAQAGDDVVWDLGTVLAGSSGERSFTVSIDADGVAGGALDASAQLEDSGTFDVRVATQQVTRLAAATPVQLVVTVDRDHARPGEIVRYNLSVTNTSNAPVTGVVVEDLFPPFMAVTESHIPDGGVCPGSTCSTGERITWDLGTLPANSARTVRYEGTVFSGSSAPAEGTLLTSRPTLNFDGGSAAEKIAVQVESSRNLRTSISTDHDPVVTGENLAYQVRFGNGGSSNVLNTRLRATIPSGATFVSATQGGIQIGNEVVWDLGTLIAGTGGERGYTVAVDAGGVAGGVLEAESRLEDSTTAEVHIGSGHVAHRVAAASVRLIVTTDKDHVLPGDAVRYSLTVTNTGSAPLTGVVVEDLFPPFITITESHMPDGGVCPGISCSTGERITWDLGTLDANTTRTVNYEATVFAGSSAPPAGTVLSHRQSLSYTGGFGLETSDLLVRSAPGLVVSIDPERNPVAPGEALSYLIRFGNPGVDNALNIRLRAPIPAGTTLASIADGGTREGDDVVWDLGTVLAGTNGERRFTVTVNDSVAVGGAVEYGARLEDRTTSDNRITARGSTRLVAAGSPVRFIVTTDRDRVREGESLRYNLTVANAGASPLVGVTVDSLIGSDTSVSSANLPDGGVCPGGSCQVGERIRWDVGTLGANTSKTVRYEIDVNRPAPAELLSATSTLSYGNGPIRSATTTVAVEGQLGMTASIVSDRDPVVPGETLSYRIAFANSDSGNALNFRLRATIPAGTSFRSADQGAAQVGNDVIWDLGTVEAGAGGERSFAVTVDGGGVAGDAVVAAVYIEDETTSHIAFASRNVTRLAAENPVRLLVTRESEATAPGSRVEYAVTVTNTSAAAVTGVVVAGLAAPGYQTFTTNLHDGGSCRSFSCGSGERFAWMIGTVPAHSSHTVRYETSIASVVDGSIIRGLTTLTHDTGDASVGSDLIVRTPESLKLSIEADRNPVAPGERLAYRIVMGNTTATAARGLLLRAPIPPGTSVVSASPGAIVNAGFVQWDLKDRLLAGTYDERGFTVSVDTVGAGDAIRARAELLDAATTLKRAGSDTVTAVESVNPVRMTMTVTPDTALSDAYNYEMVLTNTTPQAVTGVVVENLIPVGMTVSTTDIQDGGVCPGGSCQAGERVIWDIGTLPPQATASVEYRGRFSSFSPAAPGSLSSDYATLVTDLNRGSVEHEFGVGTDIDADRDGLPDAWETLYFGSPIANPLGDFDGDELSNFQEYQNGTVPTHPDTDGDGMWDGWEVRFGLDPLDDLDASRDADGDGASNLAEFLAGTDPADPFSRPPRNDFNLDGTSDVLFHNTVDGRLLIWEMTDLLRSDLQFPTPIPLDWNVVGKGDFNGDGMSDVLYRHSNGEALIAEITASARSGLKRPGGIGNEWRVRGVGDFNADGTDDILYRRADGQMRIWQMKDSSMTAFHDLGPLDPSWVVAGTGDFNGDLTDDILFERVDANTNIRSRRIWEMNQSVMMVEHNSVDRNLGPLTVVGTGDFNGDRTSDVLYRNPDGLVAIVLINAFTQLEDPADVPFRGALPIWRVADTGDYNGDGTDDILLRRTTDGVAMIWELLNGGSGETRFPGGLVTAWEVR